MLGPRHRWVASSLHASLALGLPRQRPGGRAVGGLCCSRPRIAIRRASPARRCGRWPGRSLSKRCARQPSPRVWWRASWLGGMLAACSAYVPLWMTAGLAATRSRRERLSCRCWWGGRSDRVLESGCSWRAACAPASGAGSRSPWRERPGWCSRSLRGCPRATRCSPSGLLGLGLGPAASTSLVGPQSCVAWEHRGAVTSAVYAARMLGGMVVVAALGPLGTTAHGSALERSVAVALLALGGAVAAAAGAPRPAPLVSRVEPRARGSPGDSVINQQLATGPSPGERASRIRARWRPPARRRPW